MRSLATTVTLVTLVTLLGAAPALAGKKGGVTMPDSVSVAGKTLVLNGMGVREATWMKIDVYVAGLYVEHKSQNPAGIFSPPQVMRLHMQFVRDVSKGDMTEALQKGFEKNVPADARAKLKDRIGRLMGFMTGLNEGQSLTFTFVPGKGTEIMVNGGAKGTIEGDDFGAGLFSIWLGPNPPNSGLKNGLLGK